MSSLLPPVNGAEGVFKAEGAEEESDEVIQNAAFTRSTMIDKEIPFQKRVVCLAIRNVPMQRCYFVY
jgi:hypothetical protein